MRGRVRTPPSAVASAATAVGGRVAFAIGGVSKAASSSRESGATEASRRSKRVICTSTLSEKAAASTKTAGRQSAVGKPTAANAAWKTADTAGPTTTPS